MTFSELYDLAEDDCINVDAFNLNKREALSMMDADGRCYIALDPFKLKSTADEKSKLGHELGHCVTGSFYNQYSKFDVRQRHENRADKWAIKKLIPKDELNEAVADGHIEIYDLAEYFGVTEDLMRKAVCWYQHGTMATDYYFQ